MMRTTSVLVFLLSLMVYAIVVGFAVYETRGWETGHRTLVIQTVTVVLTGLVVIGYTWVTAQLVAAAQRQTEAAYRQNEIALKQYQGAIRPIVVLEFQEDRLVEESPNPPVIRNVGFGPAFNVGISPIVNGEYRAEFKTELLLPNQSGHTVVPITYKNGQYHPVGSPTMKYFIALLRQGTRDLSDLLRKEIEISYLDANGQRYTTLQTLECERPMMSIKVTYQGSKD